MKEQEINQQITKLIVDDLTLSQMSNIAEKAHDLFLHQYEIDEKVYMADMINYLLRLEIGLKAMTRLERKNETSNH